MAGRRPGRLCVGQVRPDRPDPHRGTRLRRHGIRVNALAPGPVRTENLERASPAAQRRIAESLPLQRLGRPEDVAHAAVWLCGPGADFVTGTTLAVDGGLLAGMPPFSTPTEPAQEHR